jgi:carboxyl-terminal processing protease
MKISQQSRYRGSILLFACLHFFFTRDVHAQDQRDHTAALRLWSVFLSTYEETAFDKKLADDVDRVAREQIIAAMGLKYRNLKVADYKNFPELLDVLVQKSGKSAFTLTELALTHTLPKIDRFGGYESVADMDQMEQALLQSKGGVYAIQILLEENGQIICYPEPDGPASKAGVLSGAVLLEVDGDSMRGKTLAYAKIAFAGGDSTKIKVLQPQGKEEILQITRTKEVFPDVSGDLVAGTLRIRIRNFNEGVAKSLRDLIKKNPDAKRINLDLRGNSGGLLQESLLACSLFLPKGTIIAYDRFPGQKEGEEKPKFDDNDVFIAPNSIAIVMDRGTASAAELMISCLKHHFPDKVRLFGEKTYGKSVRVVRMQLEGAGMVSITDGLLLGPNKQPWPQITPD